MELVVVAGADAGSQFTLEGEVVQVGRGQPRTGKTAAIRLEDQSISRQQACIRCEASGVSIEHVASAANATRVNGREIDRVQLCVGDRIEMGRIAIDVRERHGTNLSGFTEIMEGAAREATSPSASEYTLTQKAATARETAEEATEIRPMNVQLGELRILRGGTQLGLECEEVFPIGLGSTRIGRGDDVEVRIAEPGVSRLHAEIEIEGGSLVLLQKSNTNPTLVNGFPVLGSIELSDGDEIQLADRVVLKIRLMRAEDSLRTSTSRSNEYLSHRMESKIELDRSIEEYNVMGTFLDVDVVASRLMKVGSSKAEHIIVSFDRFRIFVSGICVECSGQVLNSNGDELMCFFEEASSAVRAGRLILERLAEFNRDRNLLSSPFRFRLGAHTGASLVDLDAGVAYSDVLDTAGHLQKKAEPNSLLISQATLDSLSEPVSVTEIEEHGEEAGALYLVDFNVGSL